MLSTELHAQTERLHVLFVRCKPPLFYSSTAAFKLHCSPLFLLETKSTIYHFKMVEFSVLYFLDALRIQFYHLKFTKMPMNLKKEKIMFWQKLIRAFYLFIFYRICIYLFVALLLVLFIYFYHGFKQQNPISAVAIILSSPGPQHLLSGCPCSWGPYNNHSLRNRAYWRSDPSAPGGRLTSLMEKKCQGHS